jgi:mannose-1-phosphate guanylyltransferase
MSLYALIMAGGVGSRLWPRSRAQTPKQFLALVSEQTMVQETQQRLEPLVTPQRTLIATGQDFVSLVVEQMPDVPRHNVFGEPSGRGTAAAAGLAALRLVREDPAAVMAVLPADHLIQRPELFRDLLAAGTEVARRGWLVTLGIEPTYPETGYGYIERGDLLGQVRGFDAYRVARFAEKPDQSTAERFIELGTYSWNSGMFIWTAARLVEELEHHLPDLYAGLQEIDAALAADPAADVTARWNALPEVTIDYGIMERAERIAVLPAAIGWSDVGSWAAVYDVTPHDPAGNAVFGRHVSPDTTGTLIVSRRLVATMGLEDMIVVDTDDVLLICPRSRAQDVKQLVALVQQLEQPPAPPSQRQAEGAPAGDSG